MLFQFYASYTTILHAFTLGIPWSVLQGAQRKSPWLLPTFATVLAGAFWSRAVVLDGYFGWSNDSTVANDPVFRQSVY